MARVVIIHVMIGGLCLVLSGAFSHAMAGLSVSPMKQEVTVKPGEVGKVTVTVTNNDREKLGMSEEVELQIVDVEATEEGGLIFPPAGTAEDSASKWMTVSRSRATIGPNQSEQVVCTITPPQSAQPGEYYASLLVTIADKERTGTGVFVRCRTASGIFVTVPGRTFPRQAKIERCELLWPDSREQPADQATASQPAAHRMPMVSVLLRNTGRARFEAGGKARIYDSRLREALSAPLVTKRACVFGGDSRLFEAAIAKPLPPGSYTLKVEMDYQSPWGKARYQLPMEIAPEQAATLARLSQRYQEGHAPIEVEPEKVSVAVRPGAARSLALAIRNVSGRALRGVAAEGPLLEMSANKWMTVEPAEFTMTKAGRKTVAVRVQVPAGVAGGTYTSAVILKVGSEGSPLLERVVPVEIEVQAER